MFGFLNSSASENWTRQLSVVGVACSFIILFFLFVCTSHKALASNEVIHDGKTYGIVSSYNGDDSAAQFYGGHLATIPDASLNDWLRGAFAGSGYGNYLSIGLKYNTTYGTPETDTSNWQWVGTGSNSPAYRNFEVGYPQTGVSTNNNDYALMRTSDGKWLDIYPSQAGVNANYGIYETKASAVPITMNCSAHCSAYVGPNGNNGYGINSTYASYSFLMPDPMNPQQIVFSGADSSISCTGGNWGGRIEANVSVSSSGQSFNPLSALAEINNSTITIGTSSDIQAGEPLTLHVDANKFHSWDEWSGSFALKRGANTLLSYNGPNESDLLVYAGETLTVQFTQSFNSFYSRWSTTAVNMWVVVPEPDCLTLLAMFCLSLFAYARQRRK
jgi:hypothetical protein